LILSPLAFFKGGSATSGKATEGLSAFFSAKADKKIPLQGCDAHAGVDQWKKRN